MEKLKWIKKGISALLALNMVLSSIPLPAFAATTDNLCDHHPVHTDECGYVEAVEGSPCTHVHDDTCGYIEAREEVPCTCEPAEDGIHQEDCGYAEAVEGSPCTHSHDELCGYAEAVEGQPCGYECGECAAAAEAYSDLGIGQICAAGNGDSGLGNWVNGEGWNIGAESNIMTEVNANVYEITYTDLPASDNYLLKFAADGTWEINWGGTYIGSGVESDAVLGGSVISFPVSHEGSDVTLKLDLTGYDPDTQTGATFTVTVIPPEGVPVCTCEVRCDRYSVNSDCAVCAEDVNGCTGREEAGYTYDEATNTYTVTTANGLYHVAELVDGGAYSANITLAADIVLNENLADKVTVAEDGTVSADDSVRKWMPIADRGSWAYSGTFDGGGHTITGLYSVEGRGTYGGLIEWLAPEGTVKNLKIRDFCLEGTYSGAIAGQNEGKIIGCSISGTGIFNGSPELCGLFGGIVCENLGQVIDCSISANLSLKGASEFGGIAYSNGQDASIIRCSNSGTLTGTKYVGGIVSTNYGTVTGCSNSGTVTGTENVGGIVGSSDGTVSGCYNTGSISATVEDGSAQVGGIAGNADGTVSGCYNTAAVSGDATGDNSCAYVGGIVGNADGTVSGCYNTAAVSGDATGDSSYAFVGGIAGNANGTVTDCYNTAAVSGDATGDYSYANVGGIVGSTCGTVSGCYNIGSIDSGGYSGGIIADAMGTYADCYYLDGCVKSGETVDSEIEGITAKTADQFASGEVAYLLNGDQSTITYRQTLLTDAYPSFTGDTVYRVENCKGEPVYSNTNENIGHNYVGAETAKPTCDAVGMMTYTCDVCGDSYEEEIKAYHDGNLEYHAAKDPVDCATPGNIEHWYCPGCDGYFEDANAEVSINPIYIEVTVDCKRPEGAADCATLICEICGQEIYGNGEHDVVACKGGVCGKCGEEVEGFGCVNLDTPACEDGICYYCGGFVAGLGHENGAWAPCIEGECSYGCGLLYPATKDHVDDDNDNYCDTCWECVNHVAPDSHDPCDGYNCENCGKWIEGQHTGGTATCTTQAVCEACGVSYGELADHNWENGECTYGCNTQHDPHTWKSGNCTVCGIACDHSGSTHTAVTDKGDGTHSFTCTVCGDATEGHSFDENGTCVCGVNLFADSDSTLTIDGTLGGKTEATEEDITVLVNKIKECLDQGITTITVTGEEPAVIEVDGIIMPAVSEAIYRLRDDESYYGKIDLILPDVTEIVDQEFYDARALNSITLPKVTTVGTGAFYGCFYLRRMTFGSVVTSINQELPAVFHMVGADVDGCDLVLNCGQMKAEYYTYRPDLENNVWFQSSTGDTTWKSITLTHSYGDWVSNGDGTHKRTCANDSTHIENGDCSGGTATCTTLAVCEACGKEYGELAAHTPDTNGKCTVDGCGYQYAAKVGDSFYETIHKALRAAEGINGCTLTLLDDVTLTSMSSYASYVNTGTFTLDLNGKTLSSNKRTLEVMGSADLTIRDSIGGGKIVSTDSSAVYLSGGKLNIESGTFEGTLDGVFLSGTSTLIVKGGTFTGSRAMITGFGSNVEIDLTAIDPSGLTLKNNGSGTFAPKLPEGYGMVGSDGKLLSSLSAEQSATVHKHEYKYTDIGDGNHQQACSCGLTTGEPAAHSTTAEDDKAATCIALAYCSVCDSEYGAVDTTNHDSSVECVNGFCPNGCYEPATLNAEGFYEIFNAGQLYWFARQVNIEGNTAANGKLMADIDLENRTWYPIGLYDDIAEANGSPVQKQYAGTFDGNNHTVSNFTATGNGSQGLFGYCNYSSAQIKNLGVINATVSGWNAGAVAGYCANLTNCYAVGCTITGASDTNTQAVTISSVGGNNGPTSIVNCWAYDCELIVGEREENYVMHPVGGIRTSDSSIVQNCYYGEIVTDAEFTSTTGATEKTEAQFASGEVAYLLGTAWGQTIGIDSYPVLGGDTVYRVDTCGAEDGYGYSNTNAPQGHNYDANGFCTKCGGYEMPYVNEEGVYEIANAGQLYTFAQLVNGGGYGLNAKLVNNITLNENLLNDSYALNSGDFRTWTPMGDFKNGYSGIFDGQGYVISGLYIPGTNTIQGMFSVVTGTVKNVILADTYVQGAGQDGGLVGYLRGGTVSNCGFDGVVKSVASGGSAGSYTAGVVAYTYGGTIENCFATGKFNSEGNHANPVFAYADTNGDAPTLTNNYYLENCSTDSTGTVNAVHCNDGVYATTEAQIASVTEEQILSGEVAYLLGGAWGQTIGTDSYPVLGGAKVYEIKVCEKTAYSNTEGDVPHKFDENGFCTATPGEIHYQPALDSDSDGFFEIGNAGQLFWFANHINTVDRTASAVLTADIDLEGRPWTPIGSTGESSNNFRGTFDGQNHTIRGLYVEGGRAGLGFFGEVRTGTVKNFTIYGEVVANTDVNYVGGVFGSICGLNSNKPDHNGATIQNITSYVNLTAKTHGIGMIGGFVGYANHETIIENCAWYGTFDAGIYRVDTGAGGFIGKIQENTGEVTIRNCGAYGTIKTGYVKNSYNNQPIIYMGGFLSFSNTNAKTVLENCLFAGRFERGANLTDQAELAAFGTLTSVSAIKNCYYLGDDGLAGAHSGSTLQPGSANVEITGVTGEQLLSGEIAYKLGSAWGQTIGTQNYPVLGGDKVYQVRNCKQEIAYNNSNADIGHNYVNGICTVCGEACEHIGGTATCTTLAVCAICGVSYGEVSTNNHDETVAFSDNGFCPNGCYEPAELVGRYYQITNAGQLYWFAAQVNSGYTNINGELKANIVVNENVLTADGELNGDGSEFRLWTPIGTGDNGYSGDFCGLEHTVSGLYFNDSTANLVGLFGYVGSGTVNYVGVIDSYFSGSGGVGGVVGCNYGTVMYAYNTGTVKGDASVGGVVGDNYSTVNHAYNTGTVSGDFVVGGVVGSNEGTVMYAYNTGSVSGGTDVGGVAGENFDTSATATNCYFDSTVYTGNAIGTNHGTATDVEGKTTAQFASGEVAYLLNGSTSEGTLVWGQSIGTHSSPVLYGETVYYGYTSCGDVRMVYTNDSKASTEKPEHTGEATYTLTEDGAQHIAAYDCCGTTVTEDHTYENGFCLCGLYDLWVAGEQISESKLTVTGTKGTATYDPATDTLTLNGFDNGEKWYSFTKNDGYPIHAAVYTISDLNVVLEGENSLSASGDGLNVAIQAQAALTIGGDGTLDAGTIYSANGTIINGGTLDIDRVDTAFDSPSTTINGGNVNVFVHTSVTFGTLTVKGGRVVLESDDFAIGFRGTILIGEGMAVYDENGALIENPDFSTLTYALIRVPCDHTQATPSYTWTEDPTITLTVTVSCTACGETFTGSTEDIDVTISDDGFTTTYTAKVTLDGKTYTDSKTVSNQVTSVNITWGSMNFTYTEDETGEGAWGSPEGANRITVTNTGNTAVTVTAAYTQAEGYEEIEGKFEASGAATHTKPAAAGETAEFYLYLEGEPNKALKNTTVGTVTISIR